MMKKIFILFILAFCVNLIACYDAVFQGIRDEIILENGVINGMSTSMVRYTDDVGDWLYVQNGCLYKKLIGYGSGDLNQNRGYDKWSKVSTPSGSLKYEYFKQEFDGRYVMRVASDSKYIYILTCQPRYDEESSRNIVDNFALYYLSDNRWVAVTKINSLIKTYTRFLDEDNYMMDASIQLMCTNAPKNEHRFAYIRIGGDVPYEEDTSKNQVYSNAGLVDATHCAMFLLDGDNATPVSEHSGSIPALEKLFQRSAYGAQGGGRVSCLGASMFTCCCCYYDGEVKFFTYYTCTTDETKDSDPSYVYFGDGRSLRYYNGQKTDLTSTIFAIKDVTKSSEPSGTRTYQSVQITYEDALFNMLDKNNSPVYTKMVKLNDGETTLLKDIQTTDTDALKKTVIVVISKSEKDGVTTYITKEMKRQTALDQKYEYYIPEITNIKENFMSSGGTAGDSILSMCYSKDRMYLGTDEDGAYKADISGGIPSKITDDNDDTKFASQMCDPYVVPMLLCTDPSLSHDDKKNSFYSSMFFYYTENNAAASYRDVGVWSYYPGSDGWNKE